MYEKLFSPIQLRGLTLRNRVVYPAMGTRFCTDDGYVLDQLVDYHAARAVGGNGLNITEAVAVYKPGAVFRMLQITSDDYIPGLKKLTDAIHAAGGKACIQLWQGGLAASTTPGAAVIMPSDMPVKPGVTLPGASVETIHEIVQSFGEAARRSVEAGFDCIEYHAAHNYSPHAFLSAAFNHRTDEYGGSLENRARYLLESIRAIRANIPADMPLLMRVPAKDDELPNGLTIEEVIQFCKMAQEAGVDVLDVSRGNLVSSAIRFEVPSLDNARGFNVENAARIRKETRMLTIAVGRINDPDQAESILADDKADMVVIGRGQIADPEFCNKAKTGRTEDILRCVGCNQGCYERCLVGEPISCLRNPAVGREAEFADLKPAETPRKVVVIGGGVGGMEAAMMAHKLGHKVVLAEASDRLGGQFLLAGAAPRKQEMAEAVQQRGEQLARAGVDIRLNTRVDVEWLDEQKPEAIIAACGATPIIPQIEGAEGDNVCGALEILRGTRKAEGTTVVIGGGLVGLEVAEYIRKQGNEVTVVEMQDKIAKDVGPGRNADIMLNVMGSGIKSVTEAVCVKISADGVTVEHKGERENIPAQSVVIAVGSRPCDTQWLEDYCNASNVTLHIIGDAKQARRAIHAIHEGVEAARNI